MENLTWYDVIVYFEGEEPYHDAILGYDPLDALEAARDNWEDAIMVALK